MVRYAVTRKGWMAVMMAVMIVGTGCDSPTKPKPVPVAPVVSIVSHQNGEFVNDSSPINTPVVLTGSATHKGSAISGSWKVNSVVHQGNSVSVTLNVGANTACFSASAEGENREKCITLNVRTDAETLDVQIVQPTAGAKVFAGDPIPCELSSKDPRKLIEDVLWTLDGEAMSCGSDKVLHVGTASISSTGTSTANPGVGNHDLKVTANARGNLKVEDEVAFEVVTPPEQFVFANKIGDEYELWMANADGTNPRRLTERGLRIMASISPNGQKMAYRGMASNGNIVIIVSNLDGSNPVMVSGSNNEGGLGPQDPVFSPDGTKVLYTAGYYTGDNGDTDFTAFIVNTDGTNRRKIPTPRCVATDPHPCYAQSTAKVLFDPRDPSRVITNIQEFRDGHPNAFDVLGTIDIETGSITRLANYPERGWGIMDVSSGGEWVVANTKDTKRIIAIRTDGSGESRYLTPEGSDGRFPWFCQDVYVCYISPANPNGVRRVDLNGNGDTEIFEISAVGNINYPTRHPFY